MVNSAGDAPTVPIFQMMVVTPATVVLEVEPIPPILTDFKVTPTGRISVSSTPVAPTTPSFLTFMV